ncbi:hypothetical protein Back11_35350 [Paenibacillus baekrokdamisoli]|uniref:Uncharacterized protein n=1 Tax=Paenibacillus baekrokdamisoli TaxID=1712516 RepID=A0A3G9ITI9_9BACL|nr:hypothetical protein [Paenibacillus baekrokdamisoli]MBB3070872.1 hypothetical protein [Paenibacillus baekrokdamisoli]BBH22190.1 hypothetical protein Back11_35350 [Paenibacillus baekrokdamisoli]
MESSSLFDLKWINGDYRPDIRAYYYKQWNDFHMGFHAHEMIEIMYVISGTCKVDTKASAFAFETGFPPYQGTK